MAVVELITTYKSASMSRIAYLVCTHMERRGIVSRNRLAIKFLSASLVPSVVYQWYSAAKVFLLSIIAI